VIGGVTIRPSGGAAAARPPRGGSRGGRRGGGRGGNGRGGNGSRQRSQLDADDDLGSDLMDYLENIAAGEEEEGEEEEEGSGQGAGADDEETAAAAGGGVGGAGGEGEGEGGRKQKRGGGIRLAAAARAMRRFGRRRIEDALEGPLGDDMGDEGGWVQLGDASGWWVDDRRGSALVVGVMLVGSGA